ncbi:two pore channel protein 1 isoform X1 [Patella vulgata]|uniref:two pore channel protein 1 isoform X1 n=1 Tax=Patella vulgata TaxID=6465 RepID=UPI00217F2413|nr:two pore channel protein 1 isoform X1 [Patella vulgata]
MEVDDDRSPRASSVNANDIDFDTVNQSRTERQTLRENSTELLVEEIRERSRQTQWQLNYQEAAIYLEEGENNDKFDTHPRDQSALPAYEVAHNRWFHLLDLIAAILVLLVAICERPAIEYFSLPVGIHASLEMLGLLILSLELGIRFKWVGWRAFFKHKRTVIKSCTIIFMLIESIVVLVRQTSHFRVTRALRPLFLIHTYYCRGVRRITRQILQSLPPILDMIILLLFFMLIFSIFGYYLFSRNKDDMYFSTLEKSFVNLFILLTTANFPDVMMPSYNQSKFYSIFFIVYLSLELYFLMNLLLAVVYDTFSNLEKTKFQKLLIHKRIGCQHAFKLLVSDQNQHELHMKHFMGMMKKYHPSKSRRDCYLVFKSLNTSNTGWLSIEEFYGIYDVAGVSWKLKNEDRIWSSSFKHPFNKIFKAFNMLVRFKWFDYVIYLVIGANFLWILIETIRLSAKSVNLANYDFTASWASIVFVCIYSVEVIIKILGKGPMEYFTLGWDVFDFLVTVLSVIGVLGERFENSFYYVIVLRPFRLLRLFKVKKRYRDVLGTLFVLFSKLTSLAIVTILVYYFFAIIGMEMFLNVDLKNCCKNTSVEDFYAYDNNSIFHGYYYLNNFENILASGVTLFELTVVNNWFIIMEGFAVVVSQWTRVYFMLFYIVMMVVMNIIVAFVLESFLFRIQYRRQMKLDDMDDDSVYRVEVSLSEEEVDMCEKPFSILSGHLIQLQADQPGAYVYKGERSRTKDDFSIKMYGDEVKTWLLEMDKERTSIIESMKGLRTRQRPNSLNLEQNGVSEQLEVNC